MNPHDPMQVVREFDKAIAATKPLRSRVCLGQFVTHEDRSEETLCFHAILAIDGKAVARISNDGRGGCMDVLPMPKDGVMDILRGFAGDVEDLASSVTKQPFHLESFLDAMVWDTARENRRIR